MALFLVSVGSTWPVSLPCLVIEATTGYVEPGMCGVVKKLHSAILAVIWHVAVLETVNALFILLPDGMGSVMAETFFLRGRRKLFAGS